MGWCGRTAATRGCCSWSCPPCCSASSSWSGSGDRSGRPATASRSRLPMWRRFVVPLALLACAVATVPTWAAFRKTTSNGSNVVPANRIFPTTETATAWSISDQADSTAANVSDQGAFLDGISFDSGSWGSAFSATRYTETNYATPLPPGLTTSSVAFVLDFKPSVSTDTVCFYFEVRRISTGAVLGTHGSTASPVQCATEASFTSTSTPLSEITSSADANDIKIRLYARNTGSRPVTIDRGNITGTASNGYGSFTLYETNYM